MLKIGQFAGIFYVAGVLAFTSACSDNENKEAVEPQSNVAATGSTSPSSNEEKQSQITSFKAIEWTDLMPEQDIEALMTPPEYLNEVEDGSEADQIDDMFGNTSSVNSDDPYQQALVSTRVIEEMDGQAIRIPGFIVPLEFGEDKSITQFFLVPFFGACIHVPPPPPNQIIFVNYPQGLKLDALYDPFWISGVIKTSLVENDMATAAYTMDMHKYELYTE